MQEQEKKLHPWVSPRIAYHLSEWLPAQPARLARVLLGPLGQGAWTPPECPQHAQSANSKDGIAAPKSACPLPAGMQGEVLDAAQLAGAHTPPQAPQQLAHCVASLQRCWHSPPTQQEKLLNEGDQTH